MTPKFYQDPDDLLDYKFNWVQWLQDDTIVDSSWTAQAGSVIDHDEQTDTYTIVWLSGGEIGKSYKVTNHIETAQGRKKDQSLLLRIREE